VFLLPPDMRDWLPDDHLVWFVLDVVTELDTARFQARATPKGSAAGRAAYDPAMLLTLLIYAYACGVYSSRQIERRCSEDVAYRVICAQDVPDHATIARFRRRHFGDAATMEDLFTQVLVLAARAGLGRLGLVAVDGTKIAANASKDASRTEAGLRKLAREMLANAEEADAAEDELFGPDQSGERVPAELVDPVTRKDRIRAALKELEDQRRAAEAEQEAKIAKFMEGQAAGVSQGGVPVGAELAVAQASLDKAIARQQAKIDNYEQRRAAAVAAGHKGPPGPPPRPVEEFGLVLEGRAAVAKAQARVAERVARAEKTFAPRRNITDLDSRLMPVRGGSFIQGYNCQAIYSADGLTLGVMTTQATNDVDCFAPMLSKAVHAGRLFRRPAPTAVHRRAARIGIGLADAGYLSTSNLTRPGPDRLIATGSRRVIERPTRDADIDATIQHPRGPDYNHPEIQAMAKRLTTDEGITAYRQRSPLAEGPFGEIKHNRGFRRYTMRGMQRADGEWTFVHAIRNILKIHQAR
jgi:transposase